MFRRDFLKTAAALTGAVMLEAGRPASPFQARAAGKEAEEAKVSIAPRGTRRIMYCSDPSTMARRLLPDPTKPDDLRRWVDVIADNGADMFVQDVYNQCFTVYWRSNRFQYDNRKQHQRFLSMLDSGIQPLQVLLDHSRKRGMALLAGFRMNDTHGIGPPPYFPAYADFIQSHPEWCLKDFPNEEKSYQEGKPLDFTVDQVRGFIFDAMKEVATLFDVDGLDMTFRNPGYFPFPHGRERAHLMTDLVRRLRAMLDDLGQTRGRRLQLGVRVFSTLEECLDMGLDVRTWITEGLIDYLSPEDVYYSDFNAPYADFGSLTRDSRCMMYPALHPYISMRRRYILRATMTPANYRALARTFYAAGADGICFFNHFNPEEFSIFRELRDPQKLARGDRHYVFDPTWECVVKPPPFGPDRTITGAVKAQRVLLDRSAAKPSGVYTFRMYEPADGLRAAELLLGGQLTPHDELDVRLNGVPLASGQLSQSGKAPDSATKHLPSFRRFPLPPAAIAYGENRLNITLTSADPQAAGNIVIDEVQVRIQPKPPAGGTA